MTHSDLYMHIVWTTRHRAPMITPRVAEFLAWYLPAVALQENATVLAMGLVSTHVHLLVRHSPVTGIPRLVQRFQGGSSRLAEMEGHAATLQWAQGYSVSSISRRHIPALLEYLQSQPRRHPSEALESCPGYVAFVPADTL